MAVKDRPWRRPGEFAYARGRIKAALRPPVTVTPAPADLVKDHDVAVPMADGVRLRVNIYRPAGDGPFPVILSAHPYNKDMLPKKTRNGWSVNVQYRVMNQPEPLSFSSETNWEAPDPVWWTQHGYAVINADTRGGGSSEGVGSLFSDEEADDIYQLIEWAARQPWCTGSVGMLGVSYLAMSQYKVAALNPPSLRAICPWEGFTDAYRDLMTPGGIPENGFSRIWQTVAQRQARLSTDFGKQRPQHPLRDEWWSSITPDLPKITVPMLVCTSFSDANLHSRGSMRAFEAAGSEDRFAYTHRGAKWAVFYGDDAKRAQLAFFDRYLRGLDVPEPPRLRLEVRENRTDVVAVRSENEWPLARTQWQELHLGDGGVLSETVALEGNATFIARRGAVAFHHVFSEDTEITGPMSVQLWVSAHGAPDADVFVGVEKWNGSRYVPFEGSYGYGRDRVASGQLRLSLREPDAAASRPYQPEHTFRTRVPLQDDDVVAVQIPLSASATLFRAGESLRLVIAGRYPQPRNPWFGHFPAHYRSSRRGKISLHWGGERPSLLRIPVIP
ncbi:CocE/NonD family hydrolase [Mycobacterium sp. 94-17]|uniref:CocE/NonD family hydrolase n=1 Tax=Mycobacterium sp. 94-17 TaxID=2986147 RepID=UPI002D1F330F|nr:CocE/NonD family hydrolase [Mycobacterium sp. 94-17]MEB4209126.1 CocE/NonD family hydrolase [Mycobacterium sp. 94-17]